MNNISDAINMSYDDITAAETTIVNTHAQRSNSLLYYIIYIILSIREYIDNMRPTGARRGRINCGSTILITINKQNTNKTNYKRSCDACQAVDVVI